ncbi:hypothetical protein ANO11243_093290 [Dothideomycetidae sp. 11243]|nr:hypothetical protein ANO11243_093290 [fungal sp. No.11243]
MRMFMRASALLLSFSSFDFSNAAAPPEKCDPNDETSAIPDKYIVTLKPHVNLTAHLEHVQALHAASITQRTDGVIPPGVFHQYDMFDFTGYAAHLAASVIDQLHTHEDVLFIEPDREFSIASVASAPTLQTQANAPWHLNQISHRTLDHEKEGYVYGSDAGWATYAYVVDSGIDEKHAEFDDRKGRVIKGFYLLGDPKDAVDTSGHGTNVAGLIGGKTFGVAKKCSLIDVKVLIGTKGTTSDVVKGYQWAVKHMVGTTMQARAVINLSLRGSFSWSLNRAINSAAKKGVTTVVSAGNEGVKSCWTKKAIAVGATDQTRKRAKFSNIGPGVALFAPGVNVESAWIGYGNAKTLTVSGTSQAAPLAAGVILLLKSSQKLADAKVTREALLKAATPGVVGDTGGAPNLFLYNGSGK